MIETNSLVHRDNACINDFCSSLLQYEVSYVSVGLIDGKSLFSAFSHPMWQENYVQNSLHYFDPSFRTAIIAPGMPIFWDMVPKTTKKAAVYAGN